MAFAMIAAFPGMQRWVPMPRRYRVPAMNRRKKINQLLKANAKKASAKLAPRSSKPKYVSKADRAKLEAEAEQAPVGV